MSIAVICWHTSFPVIALYDAKLKKNISVYKLKGDFFLDSLEYLIQHKKQFSRILVIFGIERFSQTRQVTLLTNVLAQEYGYPTAFFIPHCPIHSDSLLQTLINQQFNSLQWTKLITPRYVKEPHITKRKKHS